LGNFSLPIEFVVDHLRMLLVKYKTFDEAIDKFNLDIPDATLEEAAKILAAELGEVYDKPRKGSVGTVTHRWYTGPDEDSRQWNQLKKRLAAANWDEDSINAVDFNSTRILARTVAPNGDSTSEESGRGLVIGYVQSGKTTSFMSVASKAADAGYRLIVVLSGVTNNLRTQTQVAFNDFVAPENDPDWHWLTDENNDFKTNGNATNLLKSKQLIAVVKKNGTVLKRLLKWIDSATPEARRHSPMLVIDDEADQATPNTQRDEKRRSVVNQRVVDLLNPKLIPINSYLAYTATPFANLLLDPNAPEDIFPKDFIYSLPHGEGYFGPEQLFGRDPLDEDDQESSEGLDIIRQVSAGEVSLLGTAASPNSPNQAQLTDDLRMSLDWFFIATAVRKIREQKNVWTSMLVHTSGRIASHNSMRALIEVNYLQAAKADLSGFLGRLEKLWMAELGRVTTFGNLVPGWGQIHDQISDLVFSSKIVTDNSESIDRLNYRSAEEPFPVIAVGGNTLSRGLVLQGLISTYFLRTSKTYDALLQMGRWFGYRRGYEDLQRIWMPVELETWFRDLALVEYDIRKQIENLDSSEVSPLDLPVLIRMHPKMQITSRSRMRGQKSEIGFSEKRIETVVFDKDDKDWLDANQVAATNFVVNLRAQGFLSSSAPGSTSVARDVPVKFVHDFLNEYKFSSSAKIALQDPLLKYISKLNGFEVPELLTWDVFFFNPGSNPGTSKYDYSPGFVVNKVKRSRLNSGANSANIHHLANSFDIAFSIPEQFAHLAKEKMAKKVTSFESWNTLRAECGVGRRGLLGVYVVDKDSAPKPGTKTQNRLPLKAAEDFIGLAIFFPKSSSKQASTDYWGPPPFVSEVVDEDTEDWNDTVAEGLELEGIEE
jgi:hypothetical protein